MFGLWYHQAKQENMLCRIYHEIGQHFGIEGTHRNEQIIMNQTTLIHYFHEGATQESKILDVPEWSDLDVRPWEIELHLGPYGSRVLLCVRFKVRKFPSVEYAQKRLTRRSFIYPIVLLTLSSFRTIPSPYLYTHRLL